MQHDKESLGRSSSSFRSPENSENDIYYDVESVETDVVPKVNSDPLMEPSLPTNSELPKTVTVSFNIGEITETTPLLTKSQDQNEQDAKSATCNKSRLNSIKIAFLFLWCIVCAGFFISEKAFSHPYKLVSISNETRQDFAISSKSKVITVILQGPFYENSDVPDPSSLDYVTIGIASPLNQSGFLKQSKNFSFDINSTKEECVQTPVSKKYRISLKTADMTEQDKYVLRLEAPNTQFCIGLSVTYFNETTSEDTQASVSTIYNLVEGARRQGNSAFPFY